MSLSTPSIPHRSAGLPLSSKLLAIRGSAIAAVLLALSVGASVHAQNQQPVAPFAAGELILVFEAKATEAEIEAFYEEWAASNIAEIENLAKSPDYRGAPIRLVRVPDGAEEEWADRWLRDSRVGLAELNHLLSLEATPNDPNYGNLWGLHNTGQTGGTADADIDAPELWDNFTGSPQQVVFGIDTGIDIDHPDLLGNLWFNPGEIPGDNIDNDANGYIDDVHGINTILNNGNPDDDHNHGSHISGTMGAVGDNGVGVVGVNWTVRMGHCKFLSAGGSGTTANAIECFLYVNDLKNVRGINIHVTNNSWGGGGFSQALRDAMEGLDQPGMPAILHAAAAGNGNTNTDINPHYPSSYTLDNLISVAATNHDDVYAGFSNHGSLSVDIAAPGVSVQSTVRNGGYAHFNGTSMASPHVAGCAALLAGFNPTLTAADLKGLILNTGDPLPPQSKQTLTNDRLNCAAALAGSPEPPPDPPLGGTADLRIGKSIADDPVIAGNPTSYTVSVFNDGPQAAPDGFVVTDTLPAAAIFLSATPSHDGTCPTQPVVGQTGGTLVCTWTEAVPAGENRTQDIAIDTCPEATCGDPGLSNTATVVLTGQGGGGGGPIITAAEGLFISELIEGSGNNKAVEIYNGTGAAVDLTGYQLRIYFNGSTSAGTTVNLGGSLPDGAVYVVADDGADADILAVADLTSTASFFNGDDAIELVDATADTLDVIGQIGSDPGSQWGSGQTSTQDNSILRRPNVCAGDADGSDAYDPLPEWNGFASDYFQALGQHVADCSQPDAVELYGIAFQSQTETYRLVQIERSTGVANDIGPLGDFYFRCSSLDISADGTFYAICEGGEGEGDPQLVSDPARQRSDAPDAPTQSSVQLLTLDPDTGQATVVGETGISGAVTDIALRHADERLVAYNKVGGGYRLWAVDKQTGSATEITAGPQAPPINCCGNGLAYFEPGVDTLLGAGDSVIGEFDDVTGNHSGGLGLEFGAPLDDGFPRINAMDEQTVAGLLYTSIRAEQGEFATAMGGAASADAPMAPDQGFENNYLGVVDTESGAVTLVGPTVDDLDAIAFLERGAFDPNPDNNTVTLDSEIQTLSTFAISKIDSPDPVTAGQTLSYAISLSNLGPSNSAGTQVVDVLPAALLGATASATVSPSGSCSIAGQTVTCNLGTVGAPDQCATSFPTSFTINISAAVDPLSPCSPGTRAGCPGSPLSNTALLSSANCAPAQQSFSASASTEVNAGADVLIDRPILTRSPGDGPPALLLAGAEVDGGVVAAPEVVPAEDPSDLAPLQDDPIECLGPGDILRVTQVFHNDGPLAFTQQRDLAGPEFEAEHPGQVVGLPASCVVEGGVGSCSVTAGRAEWNGSIDVGQSISLTYQVRILGGIPSGTELRFDGRVNYDEYNSGQNTATRSSAVAIEMTDCPATVDPNRQLGRQVHLPILGFQGQDDVCRTWIEVQYIGCDPSKAVLVTWGEPGFCPPQAAGPLKVECTGLLNPGSTWNLMGAQIPTGAKSGILFKFTARQLSDVGLDDDLGFDDVVADLMCETLFFGVVGDSDDYRRFKKAYNEGLDFAGIDQAVAAGTGILAVEVLRHCPGDVTPGVEVSSRYNGIAGTHLGTYDPVFGGHGYYVPLVYAEKAGLNTVMYIQNGGLECSSVEIWFKAQDDCLRTRICEIFTLAPGESYQWDASDCVGPDWQGSAWLRASQVMGIAVDIYGRDVLMTYIGEPQPFAYAAEDDEQPIRSPGTGEGVAFGPLVYSEFQGWDSGIQVQNLSEVVNAKVKVYFLDRSGDVVTTLVDWICPRGSQTFFLPVIAGLPGSWVGSVRVESQDWWGPGTNPIGRPDIVGVAQLMKYSDVARTETQEAIAYNLLPEHKSFAWQVGSGGGGTESGVALVAIPSLLKDLDNTGTTSELAIMNLVTKPGFTDFAIFIYDQNGLLDFVCQKLHDRQVEYIDLQVWGYVHRGFKGSAIISATFWEHEVFDGGGFFLRNLVGLGAVGIERTGTRLGEDVPGDESAGSRGIPFAQGEGLEHCFLARPDCPGQP